MKRLFSIIAILLLIGSSFTSCVEEMAAPNEELDFSRCLVPTELTYKIVEGETVEFTWSNTKGATAFVLEVYTDAEFTSAPVVKEDLLSYEDLPYVADLDPDMTYYARVKAIDESGTLQDSKWGEFEPIETFAVRPTANPDLLDRTVNSITVGWSLPEGDTELDHIRVTPPIGEDEDYTKIQLTSEDVAAGKFEVTGLDASVQYTIALHFKSANRGSVTAWTRPLIDGATTVKDTAAFKQAVRDGASTILLAYADTVYNVGDITLTAPLKLYGDSSTDGVNPTVAGTLTVPAGVASLYVEGISFDGMGYHYGHLINLGDKVDITDITLKNCTQTSYSKGIFYNNNMPDGKVAKITFDGLLVQDIEGNGGDFFDIRNNNGQYGDIEIKNSTFTIGMRTAFRIDLGDVTPTKVNSFKITNCTFNNLCFVDNGNNNGLFNVRAQVAEFVLSECVFLNMNDEKSRCALISKQGTALIPKVANNFYYNCYDRFFVPNKDWAKIEGGEDGKKEAVEKGMKVLLEGDSKILENDPCVDSQRDLLNVTNADILKIKAGDPRWFEAYVPVVEDLTQNVTATGKVWDLTDGQTFKKLADKDMVRDEIRFYVQNTPINFIENGFEFTGAAVLEVSTDKATNAKTEVPVDAAIGIKVNEPGHLYLSAVAAEDGNTSAPFVVNVDGTAVGTVSVGETRKQICLSDLSEGEHTIYVYPAAGPVVLTELEWDGCTLDTPEVTIDKTSVMAGTTEKVTLSWLHVDLADSYQVKIGENVIDTKENKYVFTPDGLKLADGVYNIEVVAVPATNEHVASYPGVVKLTVEVAEDPVVRVETLWDGAYFEEAVQKYFPGYESGNITENFSYKKLRFVANDERTDGKFSAGKEGDLYYIGIGGSGKLVEGDGKNYIQFTAGGPGKLTVKATSSGDPRNVSVAVNGEEVGKYAIPSKSDAPAEHVVELSTVENDLVYIYSPSSGIRIYEIKWEPAPTAGIPSDPSAIEETYLADFSDATKYKAGSYSSPQVIDKVTFGASEDKAIDFDPSGKRIKFKGTPKLDENGLPLNRYASFKITTPGIITHKLIASNKNNVGTKECVYMVVTVGGTKSVVKLYDADSGLSSSDPVKTTTVTADHLAGATEAAVVYIFSSNNNSNLYALGFEPKPVEEGLPEDPTAINEATTANLSDQTVYVNGKITSTTVTTDKFIWGATSEKHMTFDSARSAGGRIKFEGGADVSADDITVLPTYRYVAFKTTKAGKFTHKFIAGGSTARDYRVVIAVPTKDGVVVTKLLEAKTALDTDKNTTDPIDTVIEKALLAEATEAATVYLYSVSGGANLYAIGFEPAD